MRASSFIYFAAILAGILATPARPRAAELALPIERFRLPNGLEVILQPDASVPLVYVSVWYHVGSGDDPPGKSGLAHLFEHLTFQGGKHVGKNRHFDVLKEAGASRVNGSTETFRTNYFAEVPAHQLETVLWLESDRMGYFLPQLDEARFKAQLEVVRNERRQQLDSAPYGKSFVLLNQLLYGEGHPYRNLTLGRPEELSALSLEDARTFFGKWYTPANATLLITGDIEAPRAKELVTRWFGRFPASPRPPPRQLPAPTVRGPSRQTIIDERARLRRIQYAWHSPGMFAPGDVELEILASVLGHAGSGRLQRLAQVKKWAQKVTVRQQAQGASGVFSVIVDLKPDADLRAAELEIEAELERVSKEPITEGERKRVLAETKSELVYGMEGLASRGERLQLYNRFLGDPGAISQHLRRYEDATAGRILEVAQRHLRPGGRVEVVTIPGPPGTATIEPARPAPASPVAVEAVAPPDVITPLPRRELPDEEFRAQQPAAGSPRSLQPLALERFTLASGVEVFLVPRHQLPMLSLWMVFPGGSAVDPSGKEGLAAVCTALRAEGTAELDNVAFAQALAELGSTIRSEVRVDEHALSLLTLRENLAPTLDLWAASLVRPGLRQQDLERAVDRSAGTLGAAAGNPSAVAQRLAGKIVYGAGHPLGRLVTETSLRRLTTADCQHFHEAHVRPRGAALFAVGDIDRATLTGLLEPRLHGWSGRVQAPVAIPAARPLPGRIFFVDAPGASQSVVRLLEGGPSRRAPDFVATSLMAGILGGDFSSRLNMNLREKRGYTYGAGGEFQYDRWASTFSAGAAVRADVTAAAIEELLHEIRAIRTSPPSDAELTREREGRIQELPAQFATTGYVVGAVRELVKYGLPRDHYQRFAEEARAVDRDALARAAIRHVRPAALRLLVVGDGKKVLPQLARLAAPELGRKITTIDADGQELR